MRKTLLTFVTLIALTSLARAETITATVHGMVCAFCATGIEKTFKKEATVATVKVDLPRKQVVITTKPGKTLGDAKIKEVVSYSGYKLDGIARAK
jgi:mercuric ion binding protein